MISQLIRYSKIQDNVRAGKVKLIPFTIPALYSYLPGIIPGVMYKITSHTGNGKTQFTKFIIFSSLIWAYQNKRPLKITYVALEESKEEFMDSLYLFIINSMLNVKLDLFTLRGLYKKAMSKLQLEALNKADNYIKKVFKDNLHIISEVYTSHGIYEEIKKIANLYGKVNEIKDEFTGEVVLSNFKANDPNCIFINAVDHLSLIKDAGSDTFSSIYKWHTVYCKRFITKSWNWAAINVQQQNLDSEKKAYTSQGKLIVDKVIPSLDGLGNNREVGRDDYVVIGLFSPDRYGVETFGGYFINNMKEYNLKDNIRFIYILKNRIGIPNKVLSTYFDGSHCYFAQLPNPKNVLDVATFLNKQLNKFQI